MATPGPRILVFTGDGKGKTTAALGMALRAAGHGMNVLVVQFVKADDTTGELAAVKEWDRFKIVQGGLGFLPDGEDPEFGKHKQAARAAMDKAREAVLAGGLDVLVLDEVCFAVSRKLLEEREVLELLESAGGLTSVVMTGRGATSALMDAADTVTEMRCVKHGFSAGLEARKGVEF